MNTEKASYMECFHLRMISGVMCACLEYIWHLTWSNDVFTIQVKDVIMISIVKEKGPESMFVWGICDDFGNLVLRDTG